MSQSTVSDTLRKDRMRRMSEGLEPAKIDNTDFDNADDDQPLDLDMGNRETDIRSYIDSFVSQSSDARGASTRWCICWNPTSGSREAPR